VSVDGGKEFEPAVEHVAIDREASLGGRILDIPIFLKLKPDPSAPKGAIDLYHKAQESAHANNHKKAVEQLNGALALYPNFVLALGDLGVEYLTLGDMPKAAETMEALLKLSPNDPFAHLNLGIALYNQKKLDEAETHLRQAVKLNGTLARAHYYLGMTLIGAKQFVEAQKELELTISNGGENMALAHKFLGGLYLSANKKQQAADELEKYLKLDPKAPDAERIRSTVKDLRSQP
jgi:tetratricopeptide (TPR) repeat protein